ncbi:MAG: hypothetical protein ACK4QL_11790 [Pseudanabaenaceae cyanobacterium]
MDIIDEVIADLENDDNLLRIKRLLLYVSRGVWAKNVDEVSCFGLRQLIEEVLVNVPDPDTMKRTLSEQVRNLNNRPEYVESADKIIGSIGFLYNMRDQFDLKIVQSTPSQDHQTLQKPEYIPNPFDLRSEICRNASPLQAKILIYSALYQPFSPRERDWSPIANYDLDDFLQVLYQTCNSAQELKDRLYYAAQNSELPEDNQRTAGIIYQAMRSLFPSS